MAEVTPIVNMDTGGTSAADTGAPQAEPVTQSAPPPSAYNIPPHSKTESTLAPTSEYVRYLLLALPARYTFRGTLEGIFDKKTPSWLKTTTDGWLDKFFVNGIVGRLNKILGTHKVPELQGLINTPITDQQALKALETPEGTKLQKAFNRVLGAWHADEHTREAVRYAHRPEGTNGGTTPRISEGYNGSKNDIRDSVRAHAGNIAYDYALGIGSLWLTTMYTRYVYNDIKNIFKESVAMEQDKPVKDVTYRDITQSDNKVVAFTIKNFRHKTFWRYGSDLLFFLRPVPGFRWLPVGDIMLGVKAGMAFGDSWKRKTTLFEDFVGFVNNKVNPRNGLGQPIAVGEIFDLYQHYSEQFHPNDSFQNVVSRNAVEYDVWAKSQPVFQRIAELMNNSYAYKHKVDLDAGGKPISQDDFILAEVHLSFRP
jgi:hypothetical protein